MNIVITGASSGIGQIVAHYLSAQGHQIIGTSRFQEGKFDNFELLNLDVTDDSSVEQFIRKVMEKFPKIDILINNAGFVIAGPIENTTIAEAQQQLDTNYFGVVRIIQKILPHFRANNNGKIINICSMAGQIGMPFQAHYSASKFALEGFTEALRLELAPYNIQVCNINPGDFHTNITANRKITENIGVAYKVQFETILKMYAEEENNGADPILIAKLISSLLTQKKLKVRYTIGKPSQTAAVVLKRIFGAHIFERIMKLMWKIR